LGLAAGYSLVALWKDTLYEQWWQKMTGLTALESGGDPSWGYWPYMLLLPIGLMAYTVMSPKHNWMSKVPIGIILGLWSGQQIQVWWNRFGPQILGSMKPIIPNNTASVFQIPTVTKDAAGTVHLASNAAEIGNSVFITNALSNIVFLVTLLSALSYFLFSFKNSSKAAQGFNKLGRYMLMVGFGAIFGSTVMARFALVIDRISFVWVDFFMRLLLRQNV
jgi:hypothetical protein